MVADRERRVGSFGRREEPAELPAVIVVPPVQLSAVQVPVQLVVDASSLAAVAELIQQMVCESTVAGFSSALTELGMAGVAEAADGCPAGCGQAADAGKAAV